MNIEVYMILETLFISLGMGNGILKEYRGCSYGSQLIFKFFYKE